MKKLFALRQFLIDAVPGLERDPDRLRTFVEDGSIEFHRGPNLSHQYTYTAQLIAIDWAADTDTLICPLLDWLSIYQPDLDPAQAVSFEAEILNNDAVDLALRVQLTERVVAKRDCETGLIYAEHRMPKFEQERCGPMNLQLYTRAPGSNEFEQASGWTSPEGSANG